jgi:hypothetical protein
MPTEILTEAALWSWVVFVLWVTHPAGGSNDPRYGTSQGRDDDLSLDAYLAVASWILLKVGSFMRARETGGDRALCRYSYLERAYANRAWIVRKG